jgi:ParB family transcriptional regulator, chromosome partitioning protein
MRQHNVNDVSGDAAMADEPARSRLGRGLASLIGDMGAETGAAVERARNQRRLPVDFLRANPRNPRREFAPAELDELAASVKEHGIIQPIVVRAVRGAAEAYEIIAGERRWQAAQRAGLHEVPVVVLDVNDSEALALAIVENVQRADLNPLEEAAGYQALLNEFKYHQDDVAKTVGRSRSHIANTLRLLKLPEGVKASIRSGALSAGHARALIGLDEPERLAQEVLERGLNVRQVEQLAQRWGKEKTRPPRRKPADTIELEKKLSDVLGLVVTVDQRGDGGTMQIRYRSLDQLDDIVRRLERLP